jgi:predicted CXXCH cytochrome family protein
VSAGRFLWLSIIVNLLIITSTVLAQGIVDSKHNLSRTGPGSIKSRAQVQSGLCIFCHTPHRIRGKAKAQFFGWNRADSTATYTTYESSTMYATVDQPTGASKLCLSCHDGTIALGAILSQKNVIPFQGDWEDSPANLGTNLADDHPISFRYDNSLASANGELAQPSTLTGAVKLYDDGQVQCTTCHDPHDDSNGMFLVVADPVRELCVTCHQPDGWGPSIHATSTATWNGNSEDPWPHTDDPTTTVADNVCQNCHQPHNAGGEQWLLSYELEEANCLKCHNGNVAVSDIETESRKQYSHRVEDYTGVHDAAEDPLLAGNEPHVECVDCHNPHQASSNSSTAPDVPGALYGVSGVDSGGSAVDSATYTYEVCYKCHADNNVTSFINISRQLQQTNTRLEFSINNPSSHPIEGPRNNQFVPSLFPNYQPDSMISCTDCHGNDEGTVSGGSGPDGPHGSVNEYMLVRNYNTIDNVPESPVEYALCYGCHDRNSILGDESFGEHDKHIRGEDTPCSVCHDPHGISDTQGDAFNHQFLINFDFNVVSPTAFGELRWEEGDLGPGSSRCYLACHGVEHDGWEDY